MGQRETSFPIQPDAGCLSDLRHRIHFVAEGMTLLNRYSRMACSAFDRWLTFIFSSSGASPNVQPNGG